MAKAVILLSGGLDSATCLAIAKSQGFNCYALSFDYGQRHAIELEAAKQVAQFFEVKEHQIIHLPTHQFKGSALTDNTLSVPNFNGKKEIPVTYVPARNTIFLSFALAWAEVLQAWDIFYGASSIDYSGYPDCRPEYIKAFQEMANLATKSGIEGKKFQIHAPLAFLSKAETIKLGIALGVDYSLTITCYQANAKGHPCQQCDSCYYRQKGFKEAGFSDPAVNHP